MENTTKNNSPHGCDCEPGCCETKKPAGWKIIASVVIILAATIIVIIKLSDHGKARNSGGMIHTEDTSSCSTGTVDTNKCDTTKSKCCP
ncbi:MAG: hypothetical protein HZB59_10070 [Ignavibacteriales bacterium]|nr:hypothetical protein [Ignavibacteriales bacterium]